MPWAVYDRDGKLVLDKGGEFESEQQIRTLLARGLYREAAAPPRQPAPASPPPAPAPQPAASEQRTERKLLDETRLAVGDTIQLQAQFDGGNMRLAVSLIGYLKGKSIIVTAPMRDGKFLMMREGQSFIARMFSGKNAYAFPATIIKVTNVPYPHLHLSYPAEVEAVMVRRDARVKVRVIAAVQSRNSPSAAAILSDLSTGGCSLLAENQLGQKSDEIVVKFKAPISGIEQLLTLKGIVRGIQLDNAPVDGRSRFTHGVQFVDHAPGDQVALTAFVYQKLIEDELKL
ncbi:flagellar brake protein [Azoarcus sp. KH32C]|uniref:flagellar brake protein n=1 Tax=Azoarcus sp. KH32C TaxID=748247 RepID=UPI00155A6869|nr:flagellar brake protein [Azoarcus sp. KH32C]